MRKKNLSISDINQICEVPEKLREAVGIQNEYIYAMQTQVQFRIIYSTHI